MKNVFMMSIISLVVASCIDMDKVLEKRGVEVVIEGIEEEQTVCKDSEFESIFKSYRKLRRKEYKKFLKNIEEKVKKVVFRPASVSGSLENTMTVLLRDRGYEYAPATKVSKANLEGQDNWQLEGNKPSDSSVEYNSETKELIITTEQLDASNIKLLVLELNSEYGRTNDINDVIKTEEDLDWYKKNNVILSYNGLNQAFFSWIPFYTHDGNGLRLGVSKERRFLGGAAREFARETQVKSLCGKPVNAQKIIEALN